MTVIWKIELLDSYPHVVEVPKGAKFLSVQLQAGKVCIWYSCDPTAEKEIRRIAVYMTGETIPDENEGRYLGSVLQHNGSFVIHLFEKI